MSAAQQGAQKEAMAALRYMLVEPLQWQQGIRSTVEIANHMLKHPAFNELSDEQQVDLMDRQPMGTVSRPALGATGNSPS